jgi:predicted esterase
MDTQRWTRQIGFVMVSSFAALFGLGGCQPTQTHQPALTPLPTLLLDETSAKLFTVTDFDAVHSSVGGDANQYLILGNVPVSKLAADLPAELAVFLGRWEGYYYGPPVKKDRKLVLVIQEITTQGGKAVGWSGTNLQYPDAVGDIQFRVVAGDTPSIQFQIIWPGGNKEIDTYTYDRDRDVIRGWAKLSANDSTSGPFELSRDRSFYVYKDYAQYLAGKHIYSKPYQNSQLQHYGQGYLLYLPEGYEDHPEKTWPLIFFLHGYGDRGDNTFLLAKASPFMYIREKGPLPFIIAAPLLNAFEGYSSFPGTYLDGALAEIQANYRVDAKRIYLTGLSMGGEATYRFAVVQPETFAAIAPLSAYVDSDTYSMLGRIKAVPVWAIHGAEDTVIPLARAQEPVDALKTAGGNIRFTVLEGHDHDTWTDTYSDPAFYDWLLQHARP